MNMRKRSECTCECHRHPDSVRHFVACCHDDSEDSDLLFSLPMKTPEITLVGQTEEDAIKLLEAASSRYRVVKRDGESFMVTMDFDPMRFNLIVENGIVTEITMN